MTVDCLWTGAICLLGLAILLGLRMGSVSFSCDGLFLFGLATFTELSVTSAFTVIVLAALLYSFFRTVLVEILEMSGVIFELLILLALSAYTNSFFSTLSPTVSSSGTLRMPLMPFAACLLGVASVFLLPMVARAFRLSAILACGWRPAIIFLGDERLLKAAMAFCFALMCQAAGWLFVRDGLHFVPKSYAGTAWIPFCLVLLGGSRPFRVILLCGCFSILIHGSYVLQGVSSIPSELLVAMPALVVAIVMVAGRDMFIKNALASRSREGES